MIPIQSDLVQQSLTLVSVFVNTFMYGCANSWVSNAIIYLTASGHVPSATVEQCGLMAQLFEAGRLIFAIPGGFLVDKYGRKKILITIGSLNFISWAILCFTDSLLLIYIARCYLCWRSRDELQILTSVDSIEDYQLNLYTKFQLKFCLGIAVALLYVSAYSMIGEISSPQYRGTLTSINELANMFGQLFESIVMVLANTYFALAAFTTLIAALFFPTIWWLIESPHYLANKSDLKAALRNLKIVRPGHSDWEVNQELDSIAQEGQKKVLSWFNFYKVKAFRKSLQCVLLLNIVAVTCGGPVMALYVAVMLPPNPYFGNSYYALISFSVQFIAAIGSTFVMDKFPRRQLFLSAALISFAMQFLNAVAYALFSAGADFWKWIFILNNFLYMFVDRGLISPCNCTVRSEIFPYRLKGIGNALCVIAQAMALIVSYQIYDFVYQKYGLPANFAIFAFNSALLAAVIYFLLPEMRGKSLTEVQNDMEEDFSEQEVLLSRNVTDS